MPGLNTQLLGYCLRNEQNERTPACGWQARVLTVRLSTGFLCRRPNTFSLMFSRNATRGRHQCCDPSLARRQEELHDAPILDSPEGFPEVGEAIAAEAERLGITQGQLIEQMWALYIEQR